MLAVTIFALLSSFTVTVSSQQYSAADINKIKEVLYQLVVNGQYELAVNVTIAIKNSEIPGQAITETVNKLLNSRSVANPNAISFAYKLWTCKAQNIVRLHFPIAFKNILKQDPVKIVNKGYSQAIKLDANIVDSDRIAWGETDKTSNRVSWKFIPLWENNEVVFKIRSIPYSMYLKLRVRPDRAGDRQAYGSTDAETDRHKFYLEPQLENGKLVFFIINYKFCQGLKLVVKPDRVGDRLLMSHKGELCPNEPRFKWIISAFIAPK